MNYGRFFILDYDTSRLNDGITVFNYSGLEDSKSDINKTPKFPIYLTITKESVDFRVHYFMENVSEEKKKHLHNIILSLPLSPNLEVKDGLTKVFIDGYMTTFPIKDDSGEDNYLYNLISERKAIKSTKSNDIYKKINSYSDLKIFEIFDERNVFIIDNNEIKRLIRKLILDFLFDLEHTKIFQNSPCYEHISVKLNENFFFNALANKANYYYCREIILNQDNDNKNFFLEKYFLPAEEQWMKSIIDIRSDYYFTIDKGKWFEYPETEIAKIYEGQNGITFNINNTDIKEKLKRITKKVSKWQLRKFDLHSALPVSMIFISAVILIFAFFSILPCFVKCYGIVYSSILLPLIVWLIIEFCISLKFSRGIHLFFPRLLGAILTAWITLALNFNLIKSFNGIVFKLDDCLVFKNAIIIIVLCILTFVFVRNEVTKEVPYLCGCKRSLRTLLLMLIAYSYSYIIGFFANILIGAKAFESKDIPEFAVKVHETYFFPGFLFLFSFLAMFIGLFIHLIFADKKITGSQ